MEVINELRIMKALSNLLPRASEIGEMPKDDTDIALMDPANICLIMAKSETAKRLLLRFKEKGDKWAKVPTLNYATRKGHTSKFSIAYLPKVLKIFAAYGSNPALSVGEDYPLTMEDEHFKVILAPRFEND